MKLLLATLLVLWGSANLFVITYLIVHMFDSPATPPFPEDEEPWGI